MSSGHRGPGYASLRAILGIVDMCKLVFAGRENQKRRVLQRDMETLFLADALLGSSGLSEIHLVAKAASLCSLV